MAKLSDKFKRVVFFDLAYSTESGEFKKSKLNEMEAEWTFNLLDYFAEISQTDLKAFTSRVAVVTPYRGQVARLKIEL